MEKLGDRLARGDQAAFAELYDACADRLHHYLSVYLGSREDADDVLHDTFVRLARAGKRLADVENLTAYVFTVARNESSRFLGQKHRIAASGNSLNGTMLFEGNRDSRSDFEIAELVAAALGQLTLEEREVVELKMYAELTFREIAEIAGIPQGTAATRYRAGMNRMQEWCQRELR